jgi:hypothetical protein
MLTLTYSPPPAGFFPAAVASHASLAPSFSFAAVDVDVADWNVLFLYAPTGGQPTTCTLEPRSHAQRQLLLCL